MHASLCITRPAQTNPDLTQADTENFLIWPNSIFFQIITRPFEGHGNVYFLTKLATPHKISASSGICSSLVVSSLIRVAKIKPECRIPEIGGNHWLLTVQHLDIYLLINHYATSSMFMACNCHPMSMICTHQQTQYSKCNLHTVHNITSEPWLYQALQPCNMLL